MTIGYPTIYKIVDVYVYLGQLSSWVGLTSRKRSIVKPYSAGECTGSYAISSRPTYHSASRREYLTNACCQ